MKKLGIEDLKQKYLGIDDEFLHQAEFLVILFNFWPEVQRKWLKKFKFKPKEIEQVMKISDLYAKQKVELMNKRLPKNRRDIIIIENDVIESLYKPRLLKVKAKDKVEALGIAEEYLESKHKGVLVNHSLIDKMEDFMNLQDRSVDFLVFEGNSVYSYQVELK